jgi:hypothetical protein
MSTLKSLGAKKLNTLFIALIHLEQSLSQSKGLSPKLLEEEMKRVKELKKLITDQIDNKKQNKK